MRIVALAALNRNPVANPCQFFQGNRSIRAFCGFDNLFTDNVVFVLSKTSLFTRQLFKATFSRLGLFGLELLSEAAVSMAYIQNQIRFALLMGEL